MALTATINLKYPWVCVSQTASIINITPGVGFCFAYIEQVNPSTTRYVVGDRIYFREPTSSDPVIIIGTTQYSLISEETILFTEPGALP